MTIVTKTAFGKASKILLALAILAGMLGFHVSGANAEDSRTFPETGKTVSGRFLEYWDTNGGLAQQGFPISEEMQEQSVVDGQTYTVQYFERAVFEKHPENAAPYDVLLSLLGSIYYEGKYNGNAPGQKASTTNPRKFTETGKTIGGVFRKYWEQHGGLVQQGFPVSDEFQERSTTDGKTYTVQYFERAVFERHPEKAGTAFEVQLSLLGVSAYNGRYGGGAPPSGPLTPDTSIKDFTKAGWTHITAVSNNFAVFLNSANGDSAVARIGNDGSLTPIYKIPGTGKTGITHVVAGANKFMYTYQEDADGVTIFSVGDNGALTVEALGVWKAGWSHIVIDTATGLGLRYIAATGQYLTTNTIADGNTSSLKLYTQPSTERWRYFLPIGNGLWLFAKLTQSVGTSADVERIDDEGNFESLYSIPNFPLFTNTVFDGAHVLTYSKDDGTAYTINFTEDAADTKVLKALDNWSPGWTQLVATANQVIIFYDSKAGKLMTARIEDDGNITKLKTYNP